VNQLKLLRSGRSRTAHELKENSVVHRLVASEMHGCGRIFLKFDFQQVLEVPSVISVSEMETRPSPSSDTTTFAESALVVDEACGSVSGTEGGMKLDVSMKKISSKNTTSINGAISIESVGRFGRLNMANQATEFMSRAASGLSGMVFPLTAHTEEHVGCRASSSAVTASSMRRAILSAWLSYAW